jgi:hypothetical protein
VSTDCGAGQPKRPCMSNSSSSAPSSSELSIPSRLRSRPIKNGQRRERGEASTRHTRRHTRRHKRRHKSKSAWYRERQCDSKRMRMTADCWTARRARACSRRSTLLLCLPHRDLCAQEIETSVRSPVAALTIRGGMGITYVRFPQRRRDVAGAACAFGLHVG